MYILSLYYIWNVFVFVFVFVLYSIQQLLFDVNLLETLVMQPTDTNSNKNTNDGDADDDNRLQTIHDCIGLFWFRQMSQILKTLTTSVLRRK